MKSLYVTSVDRYSGKTAVCLALGKYFKANGYKVGYLKPLSLQPWRISGRDADEDAAFVKQVLGLTAEPWELSPVVVTNELLCKYLTGEAKEDLMARVKEACAKASKGQDILILEGGGSLREGYVVDLPTINVAETLESKVLVIVRYKDNVRCLDDALAANYRLGETLIGVIINRVPVDQTEFVADYAQPFLEKHGVSVFGFLPESRGLAALTVDELIEVLDARVLTGVKSTNALVENLTIGAMTAEAALSRFRKQRSKAVITGGDRTDIQLAALETSTTCLILTGNLQPSPLIIQQADRLGVPILSVRENTMETIEAIDAIFGKTRLGQAAKLESFQKLLSEYVNLDQLFERVGL
jgi:BioD-like phosphotransacetylase family protein